MKNHNPLTSPNLDAIGETLPTIVLPIADYLPYVVHQDLIYISGQIPIVDGQPTHIGRVGVEITLEDAQMAARRCAVNIIALIAHAIGGDWSRFERVIKLGGFVNAGPDFTAHPQVINGASQLFGEVFGARGRHARFAVGATNLPLGVPVEIDAVVALKG